MEENEKPWTAEDEEEHAKEVGRRLFKEKQKMTPNQLAKLQEEAHRSWEVKNSEFLNAKTSYDERREFLEKTKLKPLPPLEKLPFDRKKLTEDELIMQSLKSPFRARKKKDPN
jgi:hypothetical protein